MACKSKWRIPYRGDSHVTEMPPDFEEDFLQFLSEQTNERSLVTKPAKPQKKLGEKYRMAVTVKGGDIPVAAIGLGVYNGSKTPEYRAVFKTDISPEDVSGYFKGAHRLN